MGYEYKTPKAANLLKAIGSGTAERIRNEYYRARRNTITGQWEYTWASEVRSTLRSASYVDPLATQASQLPQSDHYLSGANGSAYDTHGIDAITHGFATIPADLGEPWQTRRQASEPLDGSGRGTQTRPADPSSRPRGPPESYPSQYGKYGNGQAGYQPSAQFSPFAQCRENASALSTGPFERAKAGHGTRGHHQYGPASSTQRPSSGYVAETVRYGTTYNQQIGAGGPSTEAQTSSASYADSEPRTLASLPINHVGGAAASAFASGSNFYQDQFRRILNKPHKFFVVGKVFMMLYVDNAGDKIDRSGRSAKDFTTISFGEVAHHTIRRFIVVEECSKEHFCHCLAITTYGGQGVTKPGVTQSSHTMIYTGQYPPQKLPGEERMKKDPLQMISSSPQHKLDPLSRVNLRKQHPIEHNWKVQEIGRIEPRSLPKLLNYWQSTRTGNR